MGRAAFLSGPSLGADHDAPARSLDVLYRSERFCILAREDTVLSEMLESASVRFILSHVFFSQCGFSGVWMPQFRSAHSFLNT